MSEYPLAAMWACNGTSAGADEAAVVRDIEEVAYGVLSPIIVACGLLGNLLIILILTQRQFTGGGFLSEITT